MQSTSNGRTSSSGGAYWSGSSRSSWSLFWGATFMLPRNRKNILESFTTERTSGIWLCDWVLKICLNKIYRRSRKTKCDVNVRATTSHQQSWDSFLKMRHSGQSWHSTESFHTTRTQRPTRNWAQLTWCWRTWNQRCIKADLVLLFSTMMRSWRSTKHSLRNGRQLDHQNYILWRWISRNVMIVLTPESFVSSWGGQTCWTKSIMHSVVLSWRERITFSWNERPWQKSQLKTTLDISSTKLALMVVNILLCLRFLDKKMISTSKGL